MTMVAIESSTALEAPITVLQLPNVGPEFATITNPDYCVLIHELMVQYRSEHPNDDRSPVTIAGAIDHVVSEALSARATYYNAPILAGQLALATSFAS